MTAHRSASSGFSCLETVFKEKIPDKKINTNKRANILGLSNSIFKSGIALLHS